MIHMNLGSKKFVVCAWEGGASTTPHFLTAHFAKLKFLTVFASAKYEIRRQRTLGRAKIHSPQPPFFLPARAFRIVCAARSAATIQFLSKNVRAELYNSTKIKLSDFCPTDSAARSAERYGNTGSPRTARLAKRRFETPCDFKYLLCPINL